MRRRKSSREDGHRISETSARKNLSKMKTRKSELLGEQVMVDGLMAFGKLETGERTLDFECCEDVAAEPFQGIFKVQGMRDGNVYMSEKPRRHKNKPIFRDDRPFYLFFVRCAEDDGGGTKGEEGAIADDAALLGGELYVVDEGAGVAVVVLQGVAQSAFLVAIHGDGAVVQVDTGINGLESGIGRIALLVATNHIVAHAEGDDLLVVEHVFDNDNRAAAFLVSLLVRVLVLLALAELADTHTDAELLAAVRALEY